jgi:hypothetical protein
MSEVRLEPYKKLAINILSSFKDGTVAENTIAMEMAVMMMITKGLLTRMVFALSAVIVTGYSAYVSFFELGRTDLAAAFVMGFIGVAYFSMTDLYYRQGMAFFLRMWVRAHFVSVLVRDITTTKLAESNFDGIDKKEAQRISEESYTDAIKVLANIIQTGETETDNG